MRPREFNNDPEKTDKPFEVYKLTLEDYLDKNDKDEFVRDLIISNTILEALVLSQIKENLRLERIIEKKSDPSFYFNNN